MRKSLKYPVLVAAALGVVSLGFVFKDGDSKNVSLEERVQERINENLLPSEDTVRTGSNYQGPITGPRTTLGEFENILYDNSPLSPFDAMQVAPEEPRVKENYGAIYELADSFPTSLEDHVAVFTRDGKIICNPMGDADRGTNLTSNFFNAVYDRIYGGGSELLPERGYPLDLEGSVIIGNLLGVGSFKIRDISYQKGVWNFRLAMKNKDNETWEYGRKSIGEGDFFSIFPQYTLDELNTPGFLEDLEN